MASDSAYRYVACKVGFRATPVSQILKNFAAIRLVIAYVIFKFVLPRFFYTRETVARGVVRLPACKKVSPCSLRAENV